MSAIDLSKQQALDADPRAIQQINFTANLDRAGFDIFTHLSFSEFYFTEPSVFLLRHHL